MRTNLAMAAVLVATAIGPCALAYGCSGSQAPFVSGAPDGGADSAPTSEASVSADGAPAVDSSGGPQCPAGRGPTMVQIPGPEGGAYCIDSTEVTNAQYSVFLRDTAGDAGGQPTACAWNKTFAVQDQDGGPPPASCGYDPVSRADYPVQCIDWCDARAFCAWAGKRLCRPIGGTHQFAAYSPMDFMVVGDPRFDERKNACTSGGRHPYVYGDNYVAGRCIDSQFDATAPVMSAPGCQSPEVGYAGVFDLLGNVWEFHDACLGDGGASDICAILGGSAIDVNSESCMGIALMPPNLTPSYVLAERRTYTSDLLGFRCCATL